MEWLKQHRRGMTRALAGSLICVGVFVGYCWFYRLAPARRTLDPQWYASHSLQEYWREVQKRIHRGGWFHDDGFTVGMFGDKSWAEWIMARVKPGTGMDCCGEDLCHSASSMRDITNQDIGDTADAWLDWWAQNKSKTQEQWIAEGFRKRGIEIDVPPRAEHIPGLLAVLGHAETNGTTTAWEGLRYNAFRCLRDSGFDAIGYAISNRTASAEIERGLIEYGRMSRIWPSAAGVGILPFGRKNDEDEWKGMKRPAMLEDGFQIAATGLVFGPLLLGAALLIGTFRKRKAAVESDHPN